jgi:membrane protein YqaA with SNARE-associated domain
LSISHINGEFEKEEPHDYKCNDHDGVDNGHRHLLHHLLLLQSPKSTTEGSFRIRKDLLSGNALRSIRVWIEGFAHKPSSTFALFIVSFLESSLFPIAPDLLFIPMCLVRPRRALWYAFVVVLGSTIGAMLGYVIGLKLFDSIGSDLLAFFHWQGLFETVLNKYRDHAPLALLVSGFLPIPFQVFTIGAGWNSTVPFTVFIMSLLAGRAVRFFLIGVPMYAFGERARVFVEKHFAKVVMGIGLLIVAWFLATVSLL